MNFLNESAKRIKFRNYTFNPKIYIHTYLQKKKNLHVLGCLNNNHSLQARCGRRGKDPLALRTGPPLCDAEASDQRLSLRDCGSPQCQCDSVDATEADHKGGIKQK